MFAAYSGRYDSGPQKIMNHSAQSIEGTNQFFLPNYGKRDLIFTTGQGCYLKDNVGKTYLDFGSGVSVNSLGHCHPRLVATLQQQAAKLWHAGNYWMNEPANLLAQFLVEQTFADSVFLCNSGLEANEAALKLARKYGKETGGVKKNKILCFTGAFHGRSLFTVSLGSKEEQRLPFAPLPEGIVRRPFNDIGILRQTINDDFCAVIIEPMQGEGGVREATKDFLQQTRSLCDKYEALLIYDEIQSGMGRTGKLFAYMHHNVVPDLLTNAKALGGGFPVGALLARNQYASYLSPGSHGTTFGGNALAAAVAYESIRLINNEKLLTSVTMKGEWLIEQLKKHKVFKDIRGRGLLIGASIAEPEQAKILQKSCQEKGLLVLLAGDGEVLRLAPPLIISKEELQAGIDILEEVISDF